MSKLQARAVAAQCLGQIAHHGQSAGPLLEQLPLHLSEADRSLVKLLVLGTCRHFYSILQQVQDCLDHPIKAKDKSVIPILLIGAYQLLFTRIPEHAAVHESVQAASQLGKGHLKALVNAVLRRIARTGLVTHTTPQETWNHPDWMIQKLKHNWPEQWTGILEENLKHPPMTLRVNTRKVTRAAYGELLTEQGIDYQLGKHSDTSIILGNAVPVTDLPCFDKGWVSIQDEAGQMTPSLLDLEKGQHILDACAAPGGKTCAILENSDVTLTALELETQRSHKIHQNLERLSLRAEVICADAQALDTWWNGEHFDRILLDAPCSATGVIRRHSDIKLLRRDTDIHDLSKLQLSLLKTLWKTLKSGGKLLYATCSIFAQENSRVIEQFLRSEPTARIDTLPLNTGFDTQFGHQLFPVSQGHDGFFYARLSKIEKAPSQQ